MNSLLYLLFGEVSSSSRNLWSSMASSPFEEVDLKICVSLLPSDLDDIYGSIRLNIYKFLMRYNDAMGGVVLSVSGLSFEDGAKEGRIMDEMPHVHFDVKGKALVFRPKPGQILESRVNKVTSTHIGMLVCGIFNASVASKSMGNGLSFDTIAGEWRGPGDHVIAVGSTVRIVVIRMHEAAGLISIEGSLEGLPEADGEGNGDHGGGSKSVLKKRQAGASEGDAAVATTVEASAKKSKKRAKSLGKVARSEL